MPKIEFDRIVFSKISIDESLHHPEGPLGLIHGYRVASVPHQHQLQVPVTLDVSGELLLHCHLEI